MTKLENKFLQNLENKEARTANITYKQEGVSCFEGQKSGIFDVQFLVGSSIGKVPCLHIAENPYRQF